MTPTKQSGHVVRPGEGREVDLGVARMRVLAAGQDLTGERFTLSEFQGTTAGPWTVPHLHREMEESFFILDGQFTFTVGEDHHEVGPGGYLLVPRGMPHVFEAAEGGGRFLLLNVPGGLEQMFFELAALSPSGITDPAVRTAIAARYDSVPV
jgi:quercetin dioxygenase-like cupin family protein